MSESFTAGARRLSGLVPRLLGWRPDHFWSATPAELAAIFEQPAETAAEPPSRSTLTALMERHPDG